MNEDNKSHDKELAFIKQYIMEKMKALQKDVLHCLQPPLAPMPALLWCSSCVDLLGALLSGKTHSEHSKHTSEYMEKFMGYTPDQRKLILEVFRHKLVHLAQPGPFIECNGKTIAWNYSHEYTPYHLILLDSKPDPTIPLPPWIKLRVQQIFTLGIIQFMQEIICSVIKPGGYIRELESNPEIFKNCKNAINEIFTPQSIKKGVTNLGVTKS